MSSVAAILLVLSAITHAGWNFLSKKDHPTLGFYLVANTMGVVTILPVLLFYWTGLFFIPPTVWIFVGVSGLFLAAYMAALAVAYRSGDISIAYPIARSLPAIFVALISMTLGIGEDLSGCFLFGILLVVLGCIALPMKTFAGALTGRRVYLSCAMALLAAVFIAGYTIVDHQALERLRTATGRPFSPIDATLIYMVLEGVSASVWKGAFVVCSRREQTNVKEVLTRFKRSAAITGVGIYLTYGLVLAAMNYVTNVSYVAALRQLSIPIGAIMGIVFLKEPRYLPKMLGLACIFSGLVVIAVN